MGNGRPQPIESGFDTIKKFMGLTHLIKPVLHGIRAYHRINVAHTSYPVTRTKKNTGLHVREGVKK
jgi:hypothetical protein